MKNKINYSKSFATLVTCFIFLSALLPAFASDITEEITLRSWIDDLPIVSSVRKAAVQAELGQITKVIVMDNILGDEIPTSETLADYLRRRMQVEETTGGNKRDVSKDLYGTPYRIEYPTSSQVKVISAGPDKEFETADDLYSMRSF